MTNRSGSFPFMNIAQDFGLPYGVVLRFAQSFAGEYPAITNEDETYLALHHAK